jgi:hypothetical protein
MMDTILLTAGVSAGIFFLGYWAAAQNFKRAIPYVVNRTVDMMVDGGFLLAETNERGENHLVSIQEIRRRAVDLTSADAYIRGREGDTT